MTASTHKAAVIPEKGAKHLIEDIATPVPGPDEILVKVAVTATNPIDWKIGMYGFMIPYFPYVLGTDGAGIVAQVGANVTRVKVGDRVAIKSNLFRKETSTNQEYAIADPDFVFRLPSSISLEKAATVPLGYYTSVAGLFVKLGLNLPHADASRGPAVKPDAETILIWGAASSVGQYAVQLARLAGYRVVATASPHNHDLIRSLGATEVFDYKDPDVVSKIKIAAPGLKFALDSVGTGESVALTADSLGPAGGRVAAVMPGKINRTDVTVEMIESNKVHMHDGTNEKEAGIGKTLLGFAENWLKTGEIAPNKTLVITGGLKGIDEGWAVSIKGVSAVKIVQIISDDV